MCGFTLKKGFIIVNKQCIEQLYTIFDHSMKYLIILVPLIIYLLSNVTPEINDQG